MIIISIQQYAPVFWGIFICVLGIAATAYGFAYLWNLSGGYMRIFKAALIGSLWAAVGTVAVLSGFERLIDVILWAAR